MYKDKTYNTNGAFTQSVVLGIIRCRLGRLKIKKMFFAVNKDHFTRRNLPCVNAT